MSKGAAALEGPYREYLAALVLFHQAAADAVGLDPSSYQALNLLALRGATTPGALARAIGLSTGATTRVLDRLAARGLVTREVDPQDRRRVVVSAAGSPDGLDDLLADVRRRVGEHVAALPARDLEVLRGTSSQAAPPTPTRWTPCGTVRGDPRTSEDRGAQVPRRGAEPGRRRVARRHEPRRQDAWRRRRRCAVVRDAVEVRPRHLLERHRRAGRRSSCRSRPEDRAVSISSSLTAVGCSGPGSGTPR